ncbi:LamG-like jellyroll fold domain-containing protein [Streptomyces sp. NPDC058667]|uniref:LamG domain-containing protein n=1 Tax=Streptomyces sp. NPDC058667 TaxID=3346588 RepID=UPI0036530414
MTESERALKEAAAAGARVEVVGERTERETVFANPDGATFTLEKSIAPVRVDTGSGWTRPDATLVRREDGSIGPKAAVVDLSFSDGGSGEGLVTMGQDGRSVSMGWPGHLPEPRLDGERAVYENVLPDVNLILTATVEGFRQVLEVETPAAAALPELKTIEYGLKANGLRLREGAVGSIEALDGNGRVVFRSPTARMWNSAGDDGVEPPAAGTGTQSAGFREVSGVSAESASSAEPAPEPVAPVQEGDPLAGPGAGDAAALMDVDLKPGSLTVTPAADLVTRTDAEDFPLYIDPSAEMNEAERTVLSSDGDAFYNFSGGDNGMSVGKCGSAVVNGVTYYCGSGYVNRMYFEFVPTNLQGKHVLDATFRVTETWSFSCNPRWVDLKRTNPISQASRWPGPTALDHMGDRYVSAGRGTMCSPSQPRAPIEFNDNPDEPDENLTATAKSFADGKLSVLTLRLSAQDETDTEAWKRFDDDAVLTVTYMSKPATPAEYGFPSGSGSISGSTQICSKTEGSPTTLSDPTPLIVATPRVVAGGESAAMLRVYFDVDGKNADGTWSDVPEPTTGSLAPTTGHVAYSTTLKDFPNQVKEWNVALKEGTRYRYRAFTQSFPNTSYTGTLSSGPTPWCYFKVDSTAPKPPVVTFGPPYSECVTGGSCVPAGEPGKPGTVTFSPASGDANTDYQYRLSTDAVWSGWKPAVSGSYTTTITPPLDGTLVLNVAARDAQGRVGERAVKFLVAQGSGPTGLWSFNEPSGVGYDSSTTDPALQKNLTLTTSGATRTDHGRRGELAAPVGTEPTEDKALSLSSTSQGAASTAKQVIETLSPYTVTAWARLDAAGSLNATVLGQNGNRHSAFYMGYCANVKTWCVRLPEADSDSASLSTQRINAIKSPQLGAWTHLGLVVDPSPTKKTISFYVNGVLQDKSTPFITGAWASTGGLQVGRAKYAGAYGDYFPGEIDEVAVWQRALVDGDVKREAGAKAADGSGYVELVAQYNPNGGSGSTLQDSSGYGNTLSLAGGATLGSEGISLDGVNGSGSTARPLADDTGSFTVSTAVNVTAGKLKTMPDGSRMQVLGQQTGTGSSWGIWFEKTGMQEQIVESPDPDDLPTTELVPVGRWFFGRWSSDGSGSVQSDELLTPNGEVRLTGVYDATTRTISLYTGTARQGDPKAYQTTLGSGFSIGKEWTGTTWGSYLPGTISDIRLWAGALSDENQVLAVVGP